MAESEAQIQLPRNTEAPKRRSLPSLPPFFDPRRIRALDVRSRRPGWLGAMRVRKKLVVLHTVFTIVLAVVLLLTLRPAVQAVVREAEVEKSVLLLTLARGDERFLATGRLPADLVPSDAPIRVSMGTAAELGLPTQVVSAAIATARTSRGVGAAVPAFETAFGPGAICSAGEAMPEMFYVLVAQVPDARQAVFRLYVFVVVALVVIYLLVAIALELFVLPANVYGPIQRLLEADQAVQEGRKASELISEAMMPKDELGEIMRSRNRSIAELRTQESALNAALAKIEEVATDLKRKNHLLEAAKRNLQDADRLASLGMMSAGVAHELNTPLAVIKGLTERLNADPEKKLGESDAALMLRVVQRLERLGDSLLDYARVRTPRSASVQPRVVVDEAITLVRLDRDMSGVSISNQIDDRLLAWCDADRMVQVFVNLIRNAADAVKSGAQSKVGQVDVLAERTMREGRNWVSIRVIDNGPGIDPKVLAQLFEPFVSTRLDSKGTGLGLAVAEGIVREHGGVLLARNRSDGETGAVFEVVLPSEPSGVTTTPA
ncbi:MAG: HAMP domain-containing sensor histidine kinase [Phycisphaerales bacterium]